jgi:hypothetical protein
MNPMIPKEEEQNIRYLRFLVDFSLSRISRGEVSLDEACAIYRNLRRQALRLFPDKGDTFDLIYGPRFIRLVDEVYGIDPEFEFLRRR